MKKEVIKLDGSVEEFDEEKIIKVLVAAGLSKEQATMLAGKITNWVNEIQETKVKSRQIRDRVIAELKKVDQYIAGLFTWYAENKEKNGNFKKV